VKRLNFLVVLFFVFAKALFSQENTVSLIKLNKYAFQKPIDIWNVDNLGNLYVIQNNSISKLDSSGKQTYSQSIKNLGRISKIESINAMKLVLFSEEQQSICFMDNTLTLNGNCKYFDEFDVKNAKLIATSNRPNLIWVLDEYRSTVLLIDIVNDRIIQRVENLKGILNESSDFVDLTEKNNFLYLTQANGKVYQFDQMLSETGIQLDNFAQISSDKEELAFYLKDNQFTIMNLSSFETKSINSPEKNVIDFKFQGDFLYFRSEQVISKYSVK
jgi:hypothetical protein